MTEAVIAVGIYAVATYVLHGLVLLVLVAMVDEDLSTGSAGNDWLRSTARALVRSWVVAPVAAPVFIARKAWRIAR